jgi:hypothetical protein
MSHTDARGIASPDGVHFVELLVLNLLFLDLLRPPFLFVIIVLGNFLDLGLIFIILGFLLPLLIILNLLKKKS